ncbi:MAG: hypothetical protein ABI696_01610 [Rubrivivax sp.]
MSDDSGNGCMTAPEGLLALPLHDGLRAVEQGTITRPGFGAVDRVGAHA